MIYSVVCGHTLESASNISWLLYILFAPISSFLFLSITWHISSMGRRYGGGGGGGGGKQGGGHQQELGLRAGHPLHPQHAHDLLVTHQSVSDLFSSSLMQWCLYGWPSPLLVQTLHFEKWLFNFAMNGKTLAKSSQVLKKSFWRYPARLLSFPIHSIKPVNAV